MKSAKRNILKAVAPRCREISDRFRPIYV